MGLKLAFFALDFDFVYQEVHEPEGGDKLDADKRNTNRTIEGIKQLLVRL